MSEPDQPARGAWSAGRLPGYEGVSVERIGGGQSNPTHFVTDGEARLVLR